MKQKLLLLLSVMFIETLRAQTLPSTYTKTTIVSGLTYPVAFDWLPDGSYLVTQKGGAAFPATNAIIKAYSSTGTFLNNFYDLSSLVDANFERGLLGLAVDPNFNTNHYVYAYYTHRNSAQTVYSIRIVRFVENNKTGTNPTLIFDHLYPSSVAGNHFGGILAFRPSEPGMIYFGIGDLAYNQTNPTLNYANKLNNPYGKILRIKTDGSIPTDNPFYDDGNPLTGNDDRIWSYGLRNTFGITFNRETDSMYVTENGLNAWDEFNIIHKGANYGWATCEGNYLNSSTTSPCTNPNFVNPIAEWGTPLPGITGCLYYTGNVMPEFKNHILVNDNDYGIIYDLTMGNAPAYDKVTNKKNFADVVSGTAGLTDIKQGKDECIYVMKGGYTTSGEIYRICPNSIGDNNLEEKGKVVIGNIYPNPSANEAMVDVYLASSGEITVELTDLTGRLISVSNLNKHFPSGKHQINIGAETRLANGTYLCKIRCSGVGGWHAESIQRYVQIN